MIVKIKDYNIKNSDFENKIALNTGVHNLNNLHITGINGQTIKMKTSNDGVNWDYVTNEDDSIFEIKKDISIPLFSNNVYLSLESDIDATGIVATIGLKRGV